MRLTRDARLGLEHLAQSIAEPDAESVALELVLEDRAVDALLGEVDVVGFDPPRTRGRTGPRPRPCETTKAPGICAASPRSQPMP